MKINKILKSIIITLYHANVTFCNSKYFTLLSSPEEKRIIEKSDFLKYSRNISHIITVLEIHKLFSKRDNDKISFHKFLDEIENNLSQYDSKMSVNDIKKLREKVQSINKSSFQKIQKLRDRLYAHRDPVDSDFILKNTPDLNEVEELLNVAKEIIGSIYEKLNGAKLLIDTPPENTYAQRHVERITDLEKKERIWLKNRWYLKSEIDK